MSDKATQAEPTRSRPADRNGRELDEHGLPLSGPERKRKLEELGKPDPNVEPSAWTAGVTTEAKDG